VTKRYFGAGVQEVAGDAPTNLFYSRDHLGSVREVTDANGNLVARYDYDAWGRRTRVFGTYEADWGYAGYFVHRASKLNLTWYRAYDPDLGRWVSRDPIAEGGGLNLYGYVENNPPFTNDPLGLDGDNGDPTFLGLLGSYVEGVGSGIVNGAVGTAQLAHGLVTSSRATARTVADDLAMRGEVIRAAFTNPRDLGNAIVDSIIYLGPNRAMEILGDASGQTVFAGLAARTARAAAYGEEISFGRGFRIAPFGNRTGHPTGRFPHYHRSVPHPKKPRNC
jgi:RHS repeat-associated protein